MSGFVLVSADARISAFSRRAAKLRGCGEVATFTYRDIAREIATQLVEQGLIRFQTSADGQVVHGQLMVVRP